MWSTRRSYFDKDPSNFVTFGAFLSSGSSGTALVGNEHNFELLYNKVILFRAQGLKAFEQDLRC